MKITFEVEGTLMEFEVVFRAMGYNVPSGVLEIKNIGGKEDKRGMYKKDKVKYNYAWRRLPESKEEAISAAYK
jgi:hypothetical protein